MSPWLIGIATLLAGFSWRRLLLLAGVGLAGIAGTFIWHKIAYVPRADFRALKHKYEAVQAVAREKDSAARADAESAEADARYIRELEENIDALEAHGDDPVVWDRGDIERLRALRR